jgi:hypothetical protein
MAELFSHVFLLLGMELDWQGKSGSVNIFNVLMLPQQSMLDCC